MGTSNCAEFTPLEIDSLFSSEFFFMQQVPKLEQPDVEISEWEFFYHFRRNHRNVRKQKLLM